MKATKVKKPTEQPEGNEQKKKALDMAISQITKTYGQGAIMRLGENTAMNVSAIPTGSLTLDLALGIGGVPRGRIVEIYGPESSGKTTIALHVAAEAQKRGGVAAFVDAEHALDPVYAKALGVDIDNLLVSQPDSGEQALEITEALVRSGAVDVLVVDSVAALVPQQEIDGDMGSSFRLFLSFFLCRAPARLHQKEQKFLENGQRTGALQLERSGFLSRQGKRRREYLPYFQGG